MTGRRRWFWWATLVVAALGVFAAPVLALVSVSSRHRNRPYGSSYRGLCPLWHGEDRHAVYRCGRLDARPPAFAGLSSVLPLSGTRIRLSWRPAKDDHTPASRLVYDIYRASRAGGENFARPVATTPAGARSYIVRGLAPRRTYWFVVRARDRAGNRDANRIERSARTLNAVSPTPVDSVPPIFSGLTQAVACTPGPAVLPRKAYWLSWSPATDDVTPPSEIVYDIYQAAASGGEDFSTPTYTSLPGSSSFTTPPLASDVNYYFVVRARDLAGNRDGNRVEKAGQDRCV